MWDNIIKNNLKYANVNVLKEKGLLVDGKISSKYVTLYINYKKLLDAYLSQKLNLYEYDKLFDKANLNFKEVNNDEKDIYQSASTVGLKYLYLRNNLCIEKLPIDIINRLSSLTKEDNQKINELFKIIEDTYKVVIDTNYDETTTQKNCYGLDGDDYWFDSQDLIIGFRYNELYENGLNDDEWLENNFKQNDYINMVFNKLQEEATKTLGVSVRLIKYDEETVQKTL